MKQWIAIIGSPRRGENTETLVDIISQVLEDKEITVQKFYLDMKKMSPCTNCEYCMERGECYIDDNISTILNKMKTSDGVILASPSYNYNVTGQMKILLDRTFSLNDYTNSTWSSRVEKGKKAIVVGTCKGPSQESMGYTTLAMKKVLEELEFEVLDTIDYYNTKFNPVNTNESDIDSIKDRIRQLHIL